MAKDFISSSITHFICPFLTCEHANMTLCTIVLGLCTVDTFAEAIFLYKMFLIIVEKQASQLTKIRNVWFTANIAAYREHLIS